MNNIEAYKIWAPDDALWTKWAKPTMFSRTTNKIEGGNQFDIPKLDWFDDDYNSMIIVDLDGEESVKVGMALAEEGFRPVPLFNGTRAVSQIEIIDMEKLERALYWGAEQLTKLNLKKDANPVFLLDARRMRDQKRVGYYDNRWCVFPQDMPSAEYLIKHGIKKIVVKTNRIEYDLSHILYAYQSNGISIYLADNYGSHKYQVHKPSRLKCFGYRLKVILGLKRNAAGGFGGQVPDPMTYNSGYGVRGIG